MASFAGYVYAQRGDAIFVNLFVGGTADIKMDNGRTVQMVQETRYPWDGAVRITVTPQTPGPFTMRRPHSRLGAQRAVPSDLYRFMTDKSRRR